MKVCFPCIAAKMPEAESGKISGRERIGNIYAGDISRYGMTLSNLFPAVLLARRATGKEKNLTDLRKSARLEARYVLLEHHFDCELNAAVVA
jgi:hypothetical protein